MGEQTSPCSLRLSACWALGKTTAGLVCPRRRSLWFLPGLATEKGCLSRGRHGVGVKSGNPPGSLCPGSHSLPPHSKHPTPILSGPFRLLRTPLLAQSYLKWSFCAAPGGHQHLPTLIPAPGALQRGGTSVIKSIGLESRCPRERAGSHPCTQAWCLERVQVGGGEIGQGKVVEKTRYLWLWP